MTDWGTKTKARDTLSDDVRNAYVPYISFTHYGNSSVFYHRHKFPYVNYNGRGDSRDSYLNYQIDALYQKRYGGGQMLSARFSGQIAGGNKRMSSADRFYIGGSNTVRGYEESYVGGNKGFAASIAYQLPVNKQRSLNAFSFFDFGRVYPNKLEGLNKTLVSTGLGLSASYKDLYASLTLGIPLKRNFENLSEKPGKTRIDFNCSYTF